MQLFCFTYAGGSADFYNQIEPFIASDIEVVKLEYSGHGKRRKEPNYESFNDLTEDMYSLIKEYMRVNENYALMGYSMGSIVLVEVLSKIKKMEEINLPIHVFLAAHEPINKKELIGFSSEECDELIIDRTIKFGGIPQKLINNKSFWRVYLPVYRNDYSLIGRYDFNSLDLKCKVPATILYSPTDTNPADMRKWKNYFCGDIEFFEYDGSHFFIREYCKEICSKINGILLREEKENEL